MWAVGSAKEWNEVSSRLAQYALAEQSSILDSSVRDLISLDMATRVIIGRSGPGGTISDFTFG